MFNQPYYDNCTTKKEDEPTYVQITRDEYYTNPLKADIDKYLYGLEYLKYKGYDEGRAYSIMHDIYLSKVGK